MPRTPRITSADLLRALHRARVVIPVRAGRILKPKTLAAILKSAEIAGDELPGLL
jgi:predicted RNA binding protein YcfA (HicA-like mRNA interferase family)